MTTRRTSALGAFALCLLATAGRAAAPEPRLMVFYLEAPPARAQAAAYEAYATSPAGRDLRRQFDRFKGAPFDDRFYGS